MNVKIISVLILVFLLIGYLLGTFFPINGLTIVNDAPISMGEYYGNIINAFVALGTCAAVIAALFLDEIRSWFKKVTFDIQLHSRDVLEDLIDVKGTKKAKRYHNSIQIYNKGNINARDCELYLEKAEYFKGSTTDNPIDLSVERSAIKWDDVKDNIYIPCKGKRILNLFEMTQPQKQSTPDGGGVKEIPPQLNIIGLSMNETDIHEGKWVLTYCLYSINANPKKFKFIVKWNGAWEERQTEMKSALTTQLEMI